MSNPTDQSGQGQNQALAIQLDHTNFPHSFFDEAFEDHELKFVVLFDKLYLTGEQIGKALEYAEPRKSIINIYNKNQTELDEYSGVINLMTPGGLQATRCFNRQGMMILAMLSNQPKAVPFRKWAVEVLDRHLADRQSKALEDAKKTAYVIGFQKAEDLMTLEIEDLKILLRSRSGNRSGKLERAFNRANKLADKLGYGRKTDKWRDLYQLCLMDALNVEYFNEVIQALGFNPMNAPTLPASPATKKRGRK